MDSWPLLASAGHRGAPPEFFWCFVVLAVLVFAFVLTLAVRQAGITRQRSEENLRKLAAQQGFALAPRVGPAKTPGLTGTLRGKAVEIFSYAVSNGKSSTPWIAVTVRTAGVSGLAFRLQNQGFGAKVLEFFGVHEIVVGDPAFDAAWFVRSNRPDFFRAALIPELRAKLMAARQEGAAAAFELKDGVVKYAQMGTLANAAQVGLLGRLTDVMGDLADVAEVAGP